jgi:hypothetical protein
LTSREARRLLFERISTDPEFYKSLKRADGGDEETDQGDTDGNGGGVYYDEIDSSKTINEAVQDVVERVPADSLADLYADKKDDSDASDTEDRGSGFNLDIYIRKDFLIKDATKMWMEWNYE